MPEASGYIDQNKAYWAQAVYDAPNPETYVFRAYSRVFKFDFGLDGSGHEKLLDFGCGPGGNTKFFLEKGFDVHGVDLSETDISRCKQRMPKAADHFKVVTPKPTRDDRWFGDTKFKIVTRLKSLYDMMEPGAVFYATMMAESCWYYGMSESAEDGLRLVKLRRSTDKGREGLTINDHYINFVKDEADLKKRFHMFKPRHSSGSYDTIIRDDQGSEKHLIFIGQK